MLKEYHVENTPRSNRFFEKEDNLRKETRTVAVVSQKAHSKYEIQDLKHKI